jgi:hypothetical protein
MSSRAPRYAALAACSLAPVANAAVLEYFSFAAWSTAPGTTFLGTDNLASYSGFHGGAWPGTVGSVSWIADSSFGSTVMSSYAAAPMTFTFTSPSGIGGFGGNLFVAYINFAAAPRTLSVDVTLADSTVVSFSRVNPLATDFWGFRSTGAEITSVTLSSTSEFPTVGNLSFLSAASAVPLPGAAGLAALGLAGRAGRRRR